MTNLLPPSISSNLVPSSESLPINDRKLYSPEKLILDLADPKLREQALRLLARNREFFHDLAPSLWHSFGTIPILLQEVISLYPALSPPLMTSAQSNRVCNALTLLQSVASHPETRMLFLRAQLPMYLYAFLNTSSKARSFEYLRLTTLGIIGALVKVDNPEVIKFLLQTEIVPLCLRAMENGSELSKAVGCFIIHKILVDELGLEYMCATPERFFALGRVLGNIVTSLAETKEPSPKLLKHVVRCYLSLTKNPRVCNSLRSCLPDLMRDANFTDCLYEDPLAWQWLQQLLHNLGIGGRTQQGFNHML